MSNSQDFSRNQQNQMLYPLNTSLSEDNEGDNSREESDNYVRWAPSNHMEWIENIASMSGTSLDLEDDRFKSLSVITDHYSENDIPPPPPGIKRNNTRKLDNLSQSSLDSLKECMSNESRDDCEFIHSLSLLEGKNILKKRSRDSWEESDDESDKSSRMKIFPWDPYVVTHWDKDQLIPLNSINQLQLLSERIEALPSFHAVLNSYKRVRDHFEFSIKYILDRCSEPHSSKKVLVDELCDSTTQKLEALFLLAETMRSDISPPPQVASKQKGKKNWSDQSKKHFSHYMTKWLIDNWTNPYPDEEGLQDIATALNTSTEIVSNWLINARTRKWRPAIVKACNLCRPPDMLLHDSICIFQGKKIQDFGQQDTSLTVSTQSHSWESINTYATMPNEMLLDNSASQPVSEIYCDANVPSSSHSFDMVTTQSFSI